MEARDDEDEARDVGEDGPSGLTLFISDAGGRASLPGKLQAPSAAADEQARTNVLLEAYGRMLRAVPRKVRKSCTGLLRAGEALVAVDRPVDTVSRTSGRTRLGVTYLCPEEWLLFVERGTLAVARQGEARALDLPGAWAAALGEAGLGLDMYRGYSHLRRLGHVVVCSDRDSGVLQQMLVGADRPQPALLPHSYSDVFRRLQVSAPQPALLAHPYSDRPATQHPAGRYDVYTPTHPYKKRAPGPPQFRMAVQR
ncbi:tRNA-splicing endonuclease subunit sen54 [Coemansia spiralis]|nr:tRNA-splicing endonuclease subunit sen54 [Coemansia spiralis]